MANVESLQACIFRDREKVSIEILQSARNTFFQKEMFYNIHKRSPTTL